MLIHPLIFHISTWPPRTPSVSAAMKRERNIVEGDDELESLKMVKCLMLLSRVGANNPTTSPHGSEGGFKCKTCNRVFPSFQALGGHRASHKKPKLQQVQPLKINKMHPCPFCGVQFGIGQALGGHMRKHRSAPVHHNKNINKFHDFCFDLNLTPLENDHLNLNLSTPLVNSFV